MCLGLTALRLSYIGEDIEFSLLLLLIAAFLDGIDGKVARRLKVESPTGAQLDSLADFLNFCVTPALIVYEWHLKELYFFGWAATLIFLVGGAFRLARFNVMYAKGIENVSSNFFVGVPTPAGAVLVFVPIVLELQGYIESTSSIYTAIYMTILAMLMISQIKTPSNRLVGFSRKGAPLAFIILGAVIAGFFFEPMNTYLVGVAAYFLATILFFFYDEVYKRKPVKRD